MLKAYLGCDIQPTNRGITSRRSQAERQVSKGESQMPRNSDGDGGRARDAKGAGERRHHDSCSFIRLLDLRCMYRLCTIYTVPYSIMEMDWPFLESAGLSG